MSSKKYIFLIFILSFGYLDAVTVASLEFKSIYHDRTVTTYCVDDLRNANVKIGKKIDFPNTIVVNGKYYGEQSSAGISYSEEIKLKDNEYFNSVSVRYGNVFDYIEFRTNMNRSVGNGHDGGGPGSLSGSALKIIGFCVDAYTDPTPDEIVRLQIFYIHDFTPIKDLYQK
jgi:hypothetical protein